MLKSITFWCFLVWSRTTTPDNVGDLHWKTPIFLFWSQIPTSKWNKHLFLSFCQPDVLFERHSFFFFFFKSGSFSSLACYSPLYPDSRSHIWVHVNGAKYMCFWNSAPRVPNRLQSWIIPRTTPLQKSQLSFFKIRCQGGLWDGSSAVEQIRGKVRENAAKTIPGQWLMTRSYFHFSVWWYRTV